MGYGEGEGVREATESHDESWESDSGDQYKGLDLSLLCNPVFESILSPSVLSQAYLATLSSCPNESTEWEAGASLAVRTSVKTMFWGPS